MTTFMQARDLEHYRCEIRYYIVPIGIDWWYKWKLTSSEELYNLIPRRHTEVKQKKNNVDKMLNPKHQIGGPISVPKKHTHMRARWQNPRGVS
jgi:hypothetical protein